MCSDCGTNPPLTLRCKSDEAARTLVTVLTSMGAELVNSEGNEVPPTHDGDLVTIPWNGHVSVMATVGGIAVTFGLATEDAAHAMGDAATEAATGIPAAVIRAMREGKNFADAVRPIVAEPEPDKVDDMITQLSRLVAGDVAELPPHVPGNLLD